MQRCASAAALLFWLLLAGCVRQAALQGPAAPTPAQGLPAAPTATLPGQAAEIVTPTHKPAASPPPNMTAAPAGSLTPARASAVPTENLLEMPLPEGTPQSAWNGLPVMPGALAGETDEQGYSYTVQAELVDIQSFYEPQMAALGWTLTATGTSEQGAVILLFTKGEQTATLTAARQPEGFTLVLLMLQE